ncbi:MAG TPA: hypothetical protein VFV11_07120 [Solimonas sp.]|nr:hypothetical protein [Solimonas sp.]
MQTVTGNAVLAQAMYRGVRAGGGPSRLTTWRWGYGWPPGRAYGALSPPEQAQVERLTVADDASACAP